MRIPTHVDAERILIDLVSTPSVSGSERIAAELFAARARDLGFRSEVDEAGNALAHRGSPDARTHIMLLGHIDTVPGSIPVRVEDGVLHGRGSVDAKGPLAAMLCGAARAELPDDVRVTVAGAVGEESAGSPGARFLAPLFRPSACIIGEPSGWDGVTLGYKGRLLVTATARCASTHSASREASACDEITAWWREVEDSVASFNEGRERAFDLLQATIEEMRSSADGLYQQATIEAGFRLPLDLSPEDLETRLAALATEAVTVVADGPELPYATDRNDPVVRALSTSVRGMGARPHPKLKTGTADFNVVAPQWQCPIAAYGPGDSSLDHTPHEHLALGEFHRSVEVLTSAIGALADELCAQACAVAS